MPSSHHPFRRREAAAPLLLAACAGLGLLALGANAHAAESPAVSLSGSAALTSDYVWRGSSQTQGDPAVQAGFKIAHSSGVYASVWGSNVEFAPDTHASSEFDFTVGWAGKVADHWGLDVNVLHYRYPSTTVDLNWTELNGTVTWRDNYWLSLAYSNQALGSKERGLYSQVGTRFPVNDAVRFEAAVGHYFLDDVYDRSYSHGQLSAIWAVKTASNANLELRLTAHATDRNAERIFGDSLAGSRIEAAVQATF
ncbi:TorF family putative porin [Lysobacter sp. BMK333-48F3]|uniref:TorF family putative porin n=1 Tax=Lysobacter sp. BMK333-48F3 TaxID=2867962 RepID=UPI001C8B66D6|nr:TorF family putative porin [Lysobacter sp. BMK333-48F3]MBX9403679.1 TorF family putative porin [Lysobacter sp. BMK333-48F3]